MRKSDQQPPLVAEEKGKAVSVSPMVIRRLPRYFLYLRELIRSGRMRISSNELAKMMHVTASQIRQDLNHFGGFGQQGYGYNVESLYVEIGNIAQIQENPGHFTCWTGIGTLVEAAMSVRSANTDFIYVLFGIILLFAKMCVIFNMK